MADPPRWQRGDLPFITFAGRTVQGMVGLASTDARSLILIFDGALGGDGLGLYVGTMPVIWRVDHYEDLVMGSLVTLSYERRDGE